MTRTVWRFIVLLILAVVLAAGWSWLWRYSAEEAGTTIEGWRAREAKAGRIYNCGSQSIGGFPFRFEVKCDKVSVMLQSSQPPLAISAGNFLIAAEVYAPTTLMSEFSGPLTVADPGHTPNFIANWSFGRSDLGRHPGFARAHVADVRQSDRRSGERQPAAEFLACQAHRYPRPHRRGFRREKSGRRSGAATGGGVAAGPASGRGDADRCRHHLGAAGFERFFAQAVARALSPVAGGGRAHRRHAGACAAGTDDAVGQGTLSLNAAGRLQGEMQVTVAGLEPFLAAIGAQKAVQSSPDMDKVAGALDRLLPGLGNVAREQAGANLSAGISLLGQQSTLEGQRAVTLPLRVDDGAIFLGPIKIGNAPALF